MPTLIMKFGGTSVGTADAIRQCVQIIKESQINWKNIIVVTSAMSGVTNLLLEAIDCAEAGISHL